MRRSGGALWTSASQTLDPVGPARWQSGRQAGADTPGEDCFLGARLAFPGFFISCLNMPWELDKTQSARLDAAGGDVTSGPHSPESLRVRWRGVTLSSETLVLSCPPPHSFSLSPCRATGGQGWVPVPLMCGAASGRWPSDRLPEQVRMDRTVERRRAARHEALLFLVF